MSLPREVRDFVRIIAQEDGTTFAQAMKGYEAMREFLHKSSVQLRREAKMKPEAGIKPNVELKELRRRVLETRHTLKCTLSSAVRLFSSEPLGDLVESQSHRYCREPGCARKTKPTSYYWCDQHVRDWGTEDSDTIYCPTLSNGDAEAIRAGVQRLAEKVAAGRTDQEGVA